MSIESAYSMSYFLKISMFWREPSFLSLSVALTRPLWIVSLLFLSILCGHAICSICACWWRGRKWEQNCLYPACHGVVNHILEVIRWRRSCRDQEFAYFSFFSCCLDGKLWMKGTRYTVALCALAPLDAGPLSPGYWTSAWFDSFGASLCFFVLPIRSLSFWDSYRYSGTGGVTRTVTVGLFVWCFIKRKAVFLFVSYSGISPSWSPSIFYYTPYCGSAT